MIKTFILDTHSEHEEFPAISFLTITPELATKCLRQINYLKVEGLHSIELLCGSALSFYDALVANPDSNETTSEQLLVERKEVIDAAQLSPALLARTDCHTLVITDFGIYATANYKNLDTSFSTDSITITELEEIAAEVYQSNYFISEAAELIYALLELKGQLRQDKLGITSKHFNQPNHQLATNWLKAIQAKIGTSYCSHPNAQAAIKIATRYYQYMTGASDDFGF